MGGKGTLRALSWGRRALWAVALTLLAAHLALYVYYAVALMRFPFDYDQGEGFELVDTLMFAEGRWPYRDVTHYPFYSSNYPPLFHVMLVPFAWIFGAGYWYGRLAGFLATLITAGAIGWIVWREERARWVALAAGLAYLASNTIYHVGPLFRQHITMVMFEVLSVAVLARVDVDGVEALPPHPQQGTPSPAPPASRADARLAALASTEGKPLAQARRKTQRRLALGLALLLVAGYTKQLALASAVAVFGYLFLRNPRRSLRWGLGFAAVGVAIFAWVDWATGGAWWVNAIAANVNAYFPSQFLGLFRQWLRLHGALIVPAALLVGYELYFTRLSLYSVWWVFAVANTALSGKWGAGDSYFATAIAATCVLSGIFLARTLRGGWRWPAGHPYLRRLGRLRAALSARCGALSAWAGVLVPAVYIVYALSVVKLPTEGAFFGPLADALGVRSSYGARYAFYDAAGWTPGYAAIGHIPTREDADNGWRIVEAIRSDPRPALSEEAGFSLRARRDVVTNPTQLKNLYENGLYDPAELIAMIEAQRFGVLVFRAQFYPPPVLDAAYRAYFPAEAIPMNGFRYEIWRPAPSAEVRAAFAVALENGGAVDVALTPKLAERWAAHMIGYLGVDEHTVRVQVQPRGAGSRVRVQLERSDAGVD